MPAKATLKSTVRPKNLSRHLFNHIEVAIASLTDVLALAQKGTYAGSTIDGICRKWQDQLRLYNLDYEARVSIAICTIRDLSADWPLSTEPGRASYTPVPRNDRYNMWEGPNLEARLSLIRYTLKRLRDWRRRMPVSR